MQLLTRAKAYVALVGASATALLAAVGPDGTIGGILTAVAVAATAFLTWRVPNVDELTPPRRAPRHGSRRRAS